MRTTPLDIRQQQFSVRMFRGLDAQEVDAFLDHIADDYEAVVKENALLKEQLLAQEERTRGVGNLEKTLQETLLMTRRATDDIRANAAREAELIVREAEARSEKVLEEIRAEEARIRSEVQMLRRVRAQLFEELRATVDRYARQLAGDNVGTDDEAPSEG
jgi:cell division initiation protein